MNPPANRQRRSQRLPLPVPVFVYGRAPDHSPFRDVTHMISVNAHGGLLALRMTGLLTLQTTLTPGELILVMNNTTERARICRAVYIGEEKDGKREVGIEFLRPSLDFWGVDFPPVEPTSPPNGAE